MEKFSIRISGRSVQVEKNDDKNFTLHSKDGDKHIRLKEDNDGANRWFEGSGDSETAESIEAGKAIEAYMANK
jgi:general stress protein 26